ncbi:hypothetical protein [Lactococcus garvieae]|uniref:hypothetical protein n=1 Tax=Lactococcus garvieae TaxID=1363 RepID=UPI0009BFD358|nr:hypothetical protein [Lactococcus garvieae]
MKSRLKTLILYNFFNLKYLLAMILFILLLNFGIGFIPADGTVGSIDLPVFVFIIFVGAEIFREAFNFALINGVSRKSYYISHIVSSLVITASIMLTTALIALISQQSGSNNLIAFDWLFPEGNHFEMFIWFFGVGVAILSVAWFVSLILFSLPKKVQYLLIIIMVVLSSGLTLLNFAFDGILDTLLRFGLMFVGIFGSNPANPYLSAMMFTSLAFIFVAAGWIFLRRAELK